MYNSKHKTIGILGYVYLVFALIGFLYYLVSFAINNIKPVPELVQLRSHTRTMLIFLCFMEIFIGVYIQNATNKAFLFFQALATVLLFVAHGFYIYAFFNLDGSIAFSSKSAMDVGLVLIILCGILHATTIFEYKFKSEKPPEKPTYIDEELNLEEDY